MPNSPSPVKTRITFDDHKAIASVLKSLAHMENSTVADVIRSAIRNLASEKIRNMDHRTRESLKKTVQTCSPHHTLKSIRSHKDSQKLKQASRQFDRLMLDLNLSTPDELQKANSFTPQRPLLKWNSVVENLNS